MLKRTEIAVRELALRVLARSVRRRHPHDPRIDVDRSKLLFVRQDRIGDVLISTPLLASLKRRYPHVTIDFFLSLNNAFVLANEERVRKRWIYTKGIANAIGLVRAIRRERYDFVIDLMDNPSVTSTILCALSGARWTVGIAKENDFAYDITVPLLSRRDVHIVERIAELLRPFGIDPHAEELRLEYRPAPDAARFAAEALAGLHIDAPPIGVNISPAEGARFLGLVNYRTLLAELGRRHGDLPVLLLYQPADRRTAETIARGLGHVRLSPVTRSFDQFAALVERLRLLVTPDTSAVHLGAAFRIPVVAMYVQSDADLRIWDPYATRAAVHVTPVDDLSTIPIADVIESVDRLLGTDVPGPATGAADGADAADGAASTR